MIDFRYHIVSLIAVFLALALGILMGATVVSGPLEARLRGDLERARAARADARTGEREARDALGGLQSRLQDQVGPWATRAHVAGRVVVAVGESGTESIRDDVVGALVGAGAVSAGSITFTADVPATPARATDITDRVRTVIPGFDPGPDVVAGIRRVLGEHLMDSSGPALVTALEQAGAITVNHPATDPWPPRDTAVLVLGTVHKEGDAEPSATAAFALAVAPSAPTLVLSPEAGPLTVVGVLREADDAPQTLVTFDAAGPDTDPGAIGAVAALEEALAKRGGHYGTGPGTRFVAGP